MKTKKKIFFFLGRLPVLSETNTGRNFGPLGEYFALITLKLDPWHYQCSESRGSNQLPGNIALQLNCTFVLTYSKSRVSHDMAHIMVYFRVSLDEVLCHKEHPTSTRDYLMCSYHRMMEFPAHTRLLGEECESWHDKTCFFAYKRNKGADQL